MGISQVIVLQSHLGSHMLDLMFTLGQMVHDLKMEGSTISSLPWSDYFLAKQYLSANSCPRQRWLDELRCFLNA